MRTLRPYQQEAVVRFLSTPSPHRIFFAHDVGAGKTFASLTGIQTAFNGNIFCLLIVAPAIVRENWLRECQQTLNEWAMGNTGVIRHGRKRKLSKKLFLQRELAYVSPVQIVSYDLLGDVDPIEWDAIILDEIHNLRSPTSKQSKRVKALIEANPDAHVIGLSGTLIAKDPKSVWNPVDTLFPGFLGERTPSNGIAWSFLNRYCEKEVNAYGTIYKGLREDRADELREKLAAISHRVTTQDFAAYLPPLYVQPLYSDDPRPDILKIVKEWYDSVKDEVAHIGIYCHHRQLAKDIFYALNPKGLGSHLIIGTVSTQLRDEILTEARDDCTSLIVGTTHALNQGVSLSFQKAALVVEWVTAPDQVIQFIGRFARQDSSCNAPTHVRFLVGPNDVGRSEKLCKRIEDINKLLKPGTSQTVAQEAFSGQEMGESEFETSLERLIAGTEKRSQLWGQENDDDYDEDDEA
jgi:SNF2 family DNA or RNA helicase